MNPAQRRRPLNKKVLLAVMVVPTVIVLGLIVLGTWMFYASDHTRFVLTDHSLEIRGPMYGRSILRSDLLVTQARLVNLNTDAAMAPQGRSNGISLPGYNEGWFTLANGQKALVFLTQRTGVIVVPTSRDYVLMVSPVRPEVFLAMLRAGTPAPQTFAIAACLANWLPVALLIYGPALAALVPLVLQLRAMRRQGSASTASPDPGVLYSDSLLEISDEAILLRHYYFPWGDRRVPFEQVESIEVFPLTFLSGRWRISGSGDFRTWWPADWNRPSRDRAFRVILRGRWSRIAFTAEDAATVQALLRHKGLLRPSQHA
jgi:hypothetical protein